MGGFLCKSYECDYDDSTDDDFVCVKRAEVETSTNPSVPTKFVINYKGLGTVLKIPKKIKAFMSTAFLFIVLLLYFICFAVGYYSVLCGVRMNPLTMH